ncbi:hypothetical protein [Methanofollis ethanolicus]|uniref:hypothetical protein n=1 Tax=Methanofollis ethanolicus TaxID=488124 RepID=UPI000832EDF1|nr:hypothetical protein [Methanofollis ethanolicus]
MTAEVGAAEWLHEILQGKPDTGDVSRLLTVSDQEVRDAIRRLSKTEKIEALEILKQLKIAEYIMKEQ